MNNLKNEQIMLRGNYDYIVVGSGSAGSIIAGRLSADPNITVLLIEAGLDSGNVPGVWDPNQINCLYNDPTIDWGYSTAPQAYMNNRVIPYSRAKMTGGCTAHNDMVYTRCAPADYDQWERLYGCVGWNYNNIVHNFENVEAAIMPTTTYQNQFGSAYLQACVNQGIPYNPDYNSGQNMQGVSPFRLTINNQNMRETSYQTYIAPNLSRTNLDVLILCEVTQLLFSETNITGLQFAYMSNLYTVQVNKEIILSAGAINTPAILMRSGIGDANILRSLGAPVIVADLPGVGQNLQDAIIFFGTWSSSQPITDQPCNLGYAIVWDNMNEYEQAANCCEMTRGNYTCNESTAELEGNFLITGGLFRTKSIGDIQFNSLNYWDKPILNFNFFSDPADMQQGIEAFRLMLAIGNSPGLASWRNQQLTPDPSIQTDAQIAAWIQQNAYPYNHAAGTCKMGNTQNSVVDANLRVYGVTGLRIADASVMPVIPSGHIQAPAMMIGDKAAELILSGN